MSEPKTVTLELTPNNWGDWEYVVEMLRAAPGETGHHTRKLIANQIEAQVKPDTFGYSAVIKDTKGRIWQNQRHGKNYEHYTPWYCLDTEGYGEFANFTVAEVLFEGVPFDRLDNATEEVPW